MNDELEDKLRRALRPVQPDDDFTQRLMARIAAGESSAAETRARPGFLQPRFRWLSAALAASLLLVVVMGYVWQEQREREAGLEARRQLIEALRVTSDKLDLAYQVVKTQSRAEGDENAGV